MLTRLRMALIGPALVCLLFLLHPVIVHAKPPVVNIGIVRDGPTPRFPALVANIKKEILALTADEFDVRFPASKELSGDWQHAKIKRSVDQLLADTGVDLVLTIGIISSNDISRRKKFDKPVVATIVIDNKAQGLPFKAGTSGVRNLNYIHIHKNVDQDVKVFRSIVPFKNLTFLVDGASLQSIDGLDRHVRRIARAYNLDISLVKVGMTAAAALDQIPSNTDAVLVGPLLQFSESEFEKLIQGLIARRLPSFSNWGMEEVAQGLLASQSPKSNFGRYARRIALNVQRILLGEDAGKIAVEFPLGKKLSINLATARALGISPSWDLLMEAELLNVGSRGDQESLSLAGTVQLAIEANLDLMAANRFVASGQQRVKQARSPLLPQVDVGVQGVYIDDDRAESSLGSQAERTWSGSGAVSQLIYDEDAWSNYSIEKKRQVTREEDRDALRLDIALDAAVAYLNVLRSKTLMNIQRSNLRLTRSNLELARNRLQVGYSGPSEVFRWESEIATDRRELIDARSRLSRAEIELNRLLHRPLETTFETEETRIDDDQLLANEKVYKTYLDNPIDFGRYRDFMVKEGIDAAPEVRGLNASIEARRRAVQAARRAYWLPSFSVGAEVTERFSEEGEGSDSPSLPFDLPENDDTDWSVGVGAVFPLFEGGSKRATLKRNLEELSQLRFERGATIERIDRGIRSTLHASWASFLGIDLARDGARAARRNLNLVTEEYSRGKVNIITLIDAQNASLAADESAANAVYDFLIDNMQVQRSVGQFDFFRTAEEKAAWRQRLATFFKNARQ